LVQKLNLDRASLYQKFKDIDCNVSICFTNSDIGSQKEIKKHLQKMKSNNNNNNNMICQSLTMDDNKTKLDFFLNKKDIILMKP
jgi:hypothetical protein